MKPPLIVWLAVWAMVLPVTLVLLTGRRHPLDRPKTMVVLWLLLLILENALGILWVAFAPDPNNLFLGLVFLPLEGGLILSAIALWQVIPVARSTVRFMIPLYAVVWLLAMLFVEDPRGYSIMASPVLGLIVLACALFGLVSRAHRDPEPILRTDWGWILSGLAIYSATNTTFTIPSQLGMLNGDMALLVRISIWKAWIDLTAMLIITWGLIWPTLRASSTSSSLPAPRP